MHKILIWILAILPTITIAVCYYIGSERHELQQKIPFISYSIDKPPESCIGTFGVSISAFVIFAIMFTKYKHLEAMIVKKTNTSRDRLLRLNTITMMIGGFSAICMDGVASFQFDNLRPAHLAFASLFFLTVIIHMWFINYIDNNVSRESLFLLRSRIAICTLASGTFVPMIVLNVLQTPLDMNVSAIFEISTLGLVFFFFLTYYNEFRKFKLSVELFMHEEYERVNTIYGSNPSTFESKRFLY